MATEFVRDFGGRIPLTDLPEGHPVDGKVGNQEIVVVRTVEVDAIGIYDLQTFDDATRLAAATASAKRVLCWVRASSVWKLPPLFTLEESKSMSSRPIRNPWPRFSEKK
jgi:hypothetical protein